MGASHQGKERTELQKQTLTSEEAASRIAALQRVYSEGYITRATLESLTRSIRAQSKRSETPDT